VPSRGSHPSRALDLKSQGLEWVAEASRFRAFCPRGGRVLDSPEIVIMAPHLVLFVDAGRLRGALLRNRLRRVPGGYEIGREADRAGRANSDGGSASLDVGS